MRAEKELKLSDQKAGPQIDSSFVPATNIPEAALVLAEFSTKELIKHQTLNLQGLEIQFY